MEEDSCLQMQRVWQRLGGGVDSLERRAPPGWKGGFVRVSSRDGPLCLPQSPALPSPHICTPPTATCGDLWLRPSLGCQFKLLNKAFAKSTPCSSESLWLMEERPNSSSVFLDNVSSPSSLTHNRPVPGNIHHSTHVPWSSLCASHTALLRFFLPSLCCGCVPRPPLPPGLECPSFYQPNAPQHSASRSRLIALTVVLVPVLH